MKTILGTLLQQTFIALNMSGQRFLEPLAEESSSVHLASELKMCVGAATTWLVPSASSNYNTP